MAPDFAFSMRRSPAADQYRRTRRLLLEVPAFLAAGLGAGLMLVRCILVLRENFQSDPDWQGVVMLVAILGAASLPVVLGCAAVGAVVGCVLQRLFARRPPDPWRAAGAR